MRLGFIYRHPSPQWACSPLIIPRPGSERFRFMTDVHPVRIHTKKTMANVSFEGNDCSSFGCSYFLSLRFYSRLLAISISPFIAGMHFHPYTVRCLYIQKNSTWSNEFSILLPIFNGIYFLRSSGIYLA